MLAIAVNRAVVLLTIIGYQKYWNMLYNFVVYIGTYVIWRVVSVFWGFFALAHFFHALYMLQMNTIYNVFMLLSQARERLKMKLSYSYAYSY